MDQNKLELQEIVYSYGCCVSAKTCQGDFTGVRLVSATQSHNADATFAALGSVLQVASCANQSIRECFADVLIPVQSPVGQNGHDTLVQKDSAHSNYHELPVASENGLKLLSSLPS